MDIYNKNIKPEKVDISNFSEISSFMSKRRANNFPPIPGKVDEFDNLLENWWQNLLQRIRFRQRWIRANISGRYWFIIFE